MDRLIRWSLYVYVISVGSITDAQVLKAVPEYKMESVGPDVHTVFTCLVEDGLRQEAYLKWYRTNRGQEVQITDTNGRVYIEKDDESTLKLYIQAIQTSDAGTYRCKGTVGGSDMEDSVLLELFQDITFDNAPSSQNPTEFTRAQLICQVSGNPNPTVSWRYAGKKLETGGRYTLDPSVGLWIDNVTEEDNGLYKCQAEVTATGRIKARDITVEVYRIPVITKEIGTEVAVQGQEAALKCQARGHPTPQYEFYRVEEGGEETIVSDTEVRKVDVNGGEVSFRPVNIGDQANYRCKANNAAGFATSDGYLDVQVAPEIYQYFNQTQQEGKSQSLVCLSRGEPDPEMSFRKVTNSYDYILGPNDNGRIEVTSPSSGRLELVINQLTPDDAANYTCKSRNEAGFGEQNGTITVLFAPRFIKDQKTHFYSWAGKVRNMTCHTKAEPNPTFEWYHLGKMLVNNETYKIFNHIKNSVLQVTVQQHGAERTYGTFGCLAKNAYGNATLEMTLERAMEPDPPKEVKVIEAASTMVRFKVVAPDALEEIPLLGMRVSFGSITTDYNIDEVIKIEGLRASTKYVFNIRARNEVGISVPLQFIHTTAAVRAPYPLVIISDPEGLDPYQYTLIWEKPRNGGLDIREYRFKYRRVEVEPGTTNIKRPLEKMWQTTLKKDERDNPMTTYKISGLKPDTYYQVEVASKNDIGWSEHNSQFVFHTSQAPDRAVIGSAPSQKQTSFSFWCTLLLGLVTPAARLSSAL